MSSIIIPARRVNLVAESMNVAENGGALTLEAERQSDERKAARGMVARMNREAEHQDAVMAARRRPTGYALTAVQLGERIDRAMRQASGAAARRGFTFTSEKTPELWGDCAADLAVYAMTKANTNPAERRLGAAWLAAPYGTRTADLAAGRLVMRLADVAYLPTDAEVTGNLLRQRAEGWIADHMRRDVRTDVASIDGDAEIGGALTDAKGEWKPSADADRLTDALASTGAERVAIEAALTGGTAKEQAAARGVTVGTIKAQRNRGAERLAQRLMSGELRAVLEEAGMVDLTAEERAELDGAARRAAMTNTSSTAAKTAGGPLAPRALSAGCILTGEAAVEVLEAEHSGACPLPPLVAAGGSSHGHAIDRTEPAEPYSRAHLATLPLGTAARRKRAERAATRRRLAVEGFTTCVLPDMAAAAAEERSTRERIGAAHLAAAAAWDMRALVIEEHGNACPVEHGNAARYRATAERITNGALDIGHVRMLAAPKVPRP